MEEKDKERLIKVLNLAGSNTNNNEAAVAAKTAARILRDNELTWEAVINCGYSEDQMDSAYSEGYHRGYRKAVIDMEAAEVKRKQTQTPAAKYRGGASGRVEDTDLLDGLFDRLDDLDLDNNFVDSVKDFYDDNNYLTIKQYETLQKIYDQNA